MTKKRKRPATAKKRKPKAKVSRYAKRADLLQLHHEVRDARDVTTTLMTIVLELANTVRRCEETANLQNVALEALGVERQICEKSS